MIHHKIFCLFFTIAVFWIDLAKGVLTTCTFQVPRGIPLGNLPLAYTFDVNRRPFIIYPDSSGYFTIDSEKKIVFSCFSSRFNSREFGKRHEVEVTCSGGNNFRYQQRTMEFSQFQCKNFLVAVPKKSRLLCQPNNNTIYDVGYLSPQKLFFTLYSVCFDEINLNTLYAWYQVRMPFVDRFEQQRRGEFFQEKNLYRGLDLSSIYSIPTQQITINRILKFDRSSDQIIDDKNYYLTKGHFIPRIDFYYAREQSGTCNYLNGFPQWTKSNQTWSEVEKVIRNKLGQTPYSKRVVVSGVIGTYTLPDKNNNAQYLFLAPYRRQVAVPKFHWKLIYDANDRRNNVVYISYNNRTQEPQAGVSRDIDCPPINCPGTFNNNTTAVWIQTGLIYCCTVASFQAAYGFSNDVLNVSPIVMQRPTA